MTTRPRGRPKAFNDKTDQNTVQALDRALGLLEHLAQGPGRTLSELAEETGQAVATVFRALITLQGHGMVEVEEPGQVWHIGAGAFRVGTAFLRRTKVVERARQPMDQLMRDTGETANLGMEVRGEVLFLAQVETHEAIRAFFPPGTKGPMHSSGIGKALLAWYPEDRARDIIARQGLPKFTTLTLTTETALLRDLARTRVGHRRGARRVRRPTLLPARDEMHQGHAVGAAGDGERQRPALEGGEQGREFVVADHSRTARSPAAHGCVATRIRCSRCAAARSARGP